MQIIMCVKNLNNSNNVYYILSYLYKNIKTRLCFDTVSDDDF